MLTWFSRGGRFFIFWRSISTGSHGEGKDRRGKEPLSLEFRRVDLAEYRSSPVDARIPVVGGTPAEVFSVPMAVRFEIPRFYVNESFSDQSQVDTLSPTAPEMRRPIKKRLMEEEARLPELAPDNAEVAGMMQGNIQITNSFSHEYPGNLKVVEIGYVCGDKKLFKKKGGEMLRVLELLGNRLRDEFEPKEVERLAFEEAGGELRLARRRG